MTAVARRRPRSSLAIALVAMVGGCTVGPSASPATITAVPSPVPTSTAAIAPSAPTPPVSEGFGILPGTPPAEFERGVSCSGTIDADDPVAIVQLKGAGDELGDVVLQDYADPGGPRTVCTFTGSGWLGARFVDSRHVVRRSPTDTNGLYLVVDVPEVRYRWIQLPIAPDPAFPPDLVAISPSLDRLVWVSRDPVAAASDQVHLATSSGDRVVTTLRDTNMGRCGDEDDSDFGAFTRSGSLTYVLNRPDPGDASLVVLDGETVAYSLLVPKGGWPDRGGPAMAVWSPTSETLYFRNGPDAWSWSAADGAKRFLPGVRWYRPAVSPDGTFLSYAVLAADGHPDVYLVDLAGAAEPMHVGAGHGNLPAFLDNEQLWYEGMEYTPGCEGADVRIPRVYNVADGSETPSAIDSVLATWPSTGSSH